MKIRWCDRIDGKPYIAFSPASLKDKELANQALTDIASMLGLSDGEYVDRLRDEKRDLMRELKFRRAQK